MNRSLTVWWEGDVVGRLQLNQHGDMVFAYDPAWLSDPRKPAISASLPKRADPYDRRACRPFFGGLLPEEAQREAVARALGLSPQNEFALLDALGGDVAGALTLWPEGEPPPGPAEAASAMPLDDGALIELLDTLPQRPFLAGREGLRLSLAGAQEKLPVVLADGRVALPAPGQPTTHILKPPIARFPGTTENEAFSMQLAAAIGLDVAAVEPRKAGDRTFMLIHRYDRATAADGKVRRLHQEDFCQALGIASDRKYAAEGGPTFKAAFELVRRVSARPAIDVLRLLDAAIFNVAIGNADAHGKNFSFLYTPDGIALAPLYDLMMTVAYPNLSPKLAMKIARRATLEEISGRTWTQFAADAGLGATYVRRRVGELAGTISAESRSVAEAIIGHGFDGATLEGLESLARTRSAKLIAKLKEAD